MKWRADLCFFLSLCVSLVLAESFSEVFEEQLNLRSLQDGKLAASFSFTTLLRGAAPRKPQSLADDDDSQHYTLFPLALGQILREYAVTELHLTLNAGKWSYDRWGYPDESGVGTGAELWAWMGDGGPISVDKRWQGLRNALAGLFCASLGSLDEQRTTSPILTFQPEGDLFNWTHPPQLRHASLPSEHVCTENLTPFLKLLPCKFLSGIASLLNPHKLFDADWHGIGVHVRYLHNEGVEVRLAFQAVFDPVRTSSDGQRDWSLESLFGHSIDRACPVASLSQILAELPLEKSYALLPDPTVLEDSLAVYNVAETLKPLNIVMRWPEESKFDYALASTTKPLTHISILRSLKGSSQSHTQLVMDVKNNLPVEIQASYLEAMPWHLQFYLHTLHVRAEGLPRDDLVSILSYTPPVPHSRPTLLQALLTLPPNTTLHLTMDVLKPFLRYTEHPPDAQRGWDLPPAVLIPLTATQLNSTRHGRNASRGLPQRMYTPILLVDLATPDFSMPYNVIIMSCTLIALIFGSVFNLLTRKFLVVHIHEDGKHTSSPPHLLSPVPVTPINP